MKKTIGFLLAVLSLTLLTVLTSAAAEFKAGSDGTYTIEIENVTPDTGYLLIVAAGDYTGKAAPDISKENIVYIDEVTSDENGRLVCSGFIPLTGSVGTVYITGASVPENSGLVINGNGFGYIAGKIISYTSSDGTSAVIPSGFTSIGEAILDTAPSTERVFIPGTVTEIADNAFRSGTKLYLSPAVSTAIIQFAALSGHHYAVLGDYNGDDTVDKTDLDEGLNHFASEKTKSDDFETYFDLDFNGKVTLHDLALLLQYLGGLIKEFWN